MCEESATAENIRAAAPAAVPGSAVDPITLKPVDEVVATTGIAQAPQFESGAVPATPAGHVACPLMPLAD